jgi:hypothetical protein
MGQDITPLIASMPMIGCAEGFADRLREGLMDDLR